MTETWSALYTFKHLGSAFPCPSLPPPPLPSSSRSLSSPGSPCPTQLLSLSCRCLWNRAFKNAAFWINESFFARCRRERRRRGEEVGWGMRGVKRREWGLINTEWRESHHSQSLSSLCPTSPHAAPPLLTQHRHTHTHSHTRLCFPPTPLHPQP